MSKIFTAIKENVSTLTSFIAIQLGMMIFGMIVIGAATGIGNTALLITASVFSVGFYLILLYNKAWLMGAKDKIRIDGGRLDKMPLKGLLLSFTANILNAILGILAIIGYFGINKDNITSFWAQLYAISKGIARFIQSFYIGFLNLLEPYFPAILNGETEIHPIWLIVIIIPALLVCTLGYLFGSNNYRILGFFGIKMLSNK